MTFRRLSGVCLIFLGATLAWFTLGSTIVARSGRSGSAMSRQVVELWGGRHAQAAPVAAFDRPRQSRETVTEKDELGKEVTRRVEKTVYDRVFLPIAATRARADLRLEHRRKGLLWHDTYEVDFAAVYTYRVPEEVTGEVRFFYEFPSAEAIYDGFSLRLDGREVRPAGGGLEHGVSASVELAAGAEVEVEVAYRSRGLDTWIYRFDREGVATVRDFELELTTDFERIDFPANTLSPSELERTPDGWRLVWSFDSLVSGKSIGMDLPNRLNPGPLTARITYFAPVSLLFFFTLLVVLDVLGHLRLHPAHYFFLSTAFFAFHLLMAYLVDHVDVHAAFLLAALVSIGLVVSYLRLVCGLGAALRYAGASQLVYLVLFSYAFFFKGYTGLTVTIAAILTLFLVMQLTGRVDWEKALRAPTPAEPAPEPF